MATVKSRRKNAAAGRLAAILFFAAGMPDAGEAQNKIFAARAEAEFHRAQSQFETADNSTNAIRFARACFDWADFATNKEERAAIANQGITACSDVIAREPESAAAHYYLGMDLGQLARAEFLGALRIVREMEREFKSAAELDPQLDYAGPERCLGLLYRDAPGWPASIGSKRKARSFLEEAARLAPDYPENILNLAESDLKWRDTSGAEKEMDALDALWPEAQKNFTGERWAQEWADWSVRRVSAHQKLEAMTNGENPPHNGR